jgi:hypothetical protein
MPKTGPSINGGKPLLLKFRTPATFSGHGITRDMLQELAESMGLTETGAVHVALDRMYWSHFGEAHKPVVLQERFADARSPYDAARLGRFVGTSMQPGAKNKPGITTIMDVIEAHEDKVKKTRKRSKPEAD